MISFRLSMTSSRVSTRTELVPSICFPGDRFFIARELGVGRGRRPVRVGFHSDQKTTHFHPLDPSCRICQNLVTGEQMANMSSVVVLREIAPGFRKNEDRGKLSTGIPAMDRLTEGGIPRGTLTEICGPASSGRTSFLFALIGHATQQGEYCAWIDAAGTFDPLSAAESGADLNRILWVNCAGNAEHALKAVDLLTQAGGFGVVVLDMADTPARDVRRISLASWFRLRHAAERTGAALLVAETGINAGSCSAMQIEMKRRKRPLWVGKLLRGIHAEAQSRKHYHSQSAEFMAVI
jgi:recombination protein RecA